MNPMYLDFHYNSINRKSARWCDTLRFLWKQRRNVYGHDDDNGEEDFIIPSISIMFKYMGGNHGGEGETQSIFLPFQNIEWSPPTEAKVEQTNSERDKSHKI